MDKTQVLKDFFETSEVLVVDKNPSSRNRMLKIICDLGANIHSVHAAKGLTEVEQIIKDKEISLVLTDYSIVGGSGFDIFRMVREKFPLNKKLILVLVTSTISQSTVAKAAEEDVDSFIIKPFDFQGFRETLITTIVDRLEPSEYFRKIELAKSAIFESKLDIAVDILKSALTLHPKPALAMSYLGHVEYMRNYSLEARNDFEKGIGHNEIHFKCLIGLFELYMKEKRYHLAYGLVKKIVKYYPANPDRLTQVIRLAVQTENYSDMQVFYEIFTSLDEQDPVLVNHIGAGMYVSGKHFLKNNNLIEAIRFFDHIADSCSDHTKFLRGIITTLIQVRQIKSAEKYLSRFPVESRKQEDYKVCEFLILSEMTENKAMIIKHGLNLYHQKIKDYDCLKVLIRMMEESGYKKDRIAKFRAELAYLNQQFVA